MDSVACWNVRGLNKAHGQIDVKSFLFKNNVLLTGLLETKIRSSNKYRTLWFLGDWQCLDNYDHASNGRIWVLWNS